MRDKMNTLQLLSGNILAYHNFKLRLEELTNA